MLYVSQTKCAAELIPSRNLLALVKILTLTRVKLFTLTFCPPRGNLVHNDEF